MRGAGFTRVTITGGGLAVLRESRKLDALEKQWVRARLAEESLELGVGDGSLVLFQELPLRRIGQGVAEVIDCTGGGGRRVEEAAYA